MIGIAALVSSVACVPWREVCTARVAPSTTGPTYSRCDGLDSSRTSTLSLVAALVGALGAVVVLDVAGAALRDRGHGLDRGRALELAEDRLVRAAQVVGEHVEPAAVGHADDHFAGALGGRELDHLVEHRDRHVQTLDRELLLAQVGLVHEALERVDLGQAAQQRDLLLGPERLAVGAGLDLLAQPDALAVRGDVLDLVGDRAAVGLAQVRDDVGQRLAGHADAQDRGRDLGHDLGRQLQRLGVERGVALGLGAERVQPRGQVAVRAVRLDQRHRGLDGLQQLEVRLAGHGRRRLGLGRRRRARRSASARSAPAPISTPRSEKTCS